MNNVPAVTRKAPWLLALALGSVWLLAAVAVAQPPALKGRLVDRQGNVHEVSRLTYGGRQEIECTVSGQRELIPLRQIKRLRFEGEKGDEEQGLLITLQDGRTLTGSMYTGASLTPHQDAVGGGGTTLRFSGTTSLGPFFILVSDVRELVMEDVAVAADSGPQSLAATVITVEGKRFDVTALECRGEDRITYSQGNRRRFIDLSKVERIDFAEGSANEEQRPVTIVCWSGKRIQGTVEAGRVRLQGETDRGYFERVSAAWTGRSRVGAFALGMHAVKQIRFVAPDSDQDAEEPAGGSSEEGSGGETRP